MKKQYQVSFITLDGSVFYKGTYRDKKRFRAAKDRLDNQYGGYLRTEIMDLSTNAKVLFIGAGVLK